MEVGVPLAVTVRMLLFEGCFGSFPRVGVTAGEVDTASDATVELRLRVLVRALRALFLRDLLRLLCCLDGALKGGASSYSSEDGQLLSVEAGEGESSSSRSSSVHVCCPATLDNGEGCTLALRWLQCPDIRDGPATLAAWSGSSSCE